MKTLSLWSSSHKKKLACRRQVCPSLRNLCRRKRVRRLASVKFSGSGTSTDLRNRLGKRLCQRFRPRTAGYRLCWSAIPHTFACNHFACGWALWLPVTRRWRRKWLMLRPILKRLEKIHLNNRFKCDQIDHSIGHSNTNFGVIIFAVIWMSWFMQIYSNLPVT